jgi:hypothetical protein
MAGIEFIDENGDGPGVCLRKGKTKQADKNPMGYVQGFVLASCPQEGPNCLSHFRPADPKGRAIFGNPSRNQTSTIFVWLRWGPYCMLVGMIAAPLHINKYGQRLLKRLLLAFVPP